MDEVRIRTGSASDVDAAVALFSELDRFERGWRIFEPRADIFDRTRKHYEELVAEGSGILVLAETGGRLVGMGVAEVARPSMVSDEQAVEISNVFVDPDFRGRGIGRAIVRELVNFAEGRGVERMVLKVFSANQSGERFWTSLGFEPRYTQFIARTEEVGGSEQQESG
ncbi:MAG TPA: GNAT family N-acetyltransferase [Actinomycetota bacterium]